MLPSSSFWMLDLDSHVEFECVSTNVNLPSGNNKKGSTNYKNLKHEALYNITTLLSRTPNVGGWLERRNSIEGTLGF